MSAPDVETGADLLDQVHDAFKRYVVFPSPEAADAVTLFTAATHAQPAWEHATRLVVKSPQKRCGKSRLQEIASELCHNPLKTTNISPAALVRSIGLVDPPTIILDEADAVFATRRGERSEGAEDLRGLLNSGHSRGWPYIRWDATARKAESCPTFAMAILGGIGDMPDTIEDRAVIVSMRRRAPGEQVEPFRRRRCIGPLQAVRGKLHTWVGKHHDALAEAEPDLPVEDRAADVWEPLVAIAELAGGDWPDRARKACRALTGTGDSGDGDGARLLGDLWGVFGPTDRMGTTTILERLNADEAAPWGGWHRGQGLNARDLAKLLKPYDVKPTDIKVDGGTVKGYLADALADPWARYVPASRGPQAHIRNEGNQGNFPASEVAQVAQVADVRPNSASSLFGTDSDWHGPSDEDIARYEREAAAS